MLLTKSLPGWPATTWDPNADALDQLRVLTEQAPSRQLGQPGNEVVDQLIAARFAEAVKKHNDPQRWAEAQAALAEVEVADEKLAHAVAMKRRGTTVAGAVQRSGALTRLTLEEPLVFCFVLLAIAVAFLVTWRFQKRAALVVAAVVLIALSVALFVAARLVETDYEKTAAVADQQAGTREGAERALNEAAAAAYAADLKAAKAWKGLWQCGRVRYDAPVFVPGKATLSAGEKQARLYQLAPNLGNPGNLPADGFRGPIVYAGKGTSAELTGLNLKGAAALMEFDSDKRWLDAIQLGAELVILLEPPQGENVTFQQSIRKLSATPLSIPRFYMTRATLLELFGPNWQEELKSHPRVTIESAPARWESREVAADWLFIPGTVEPTYGNFQEDVGRQLVHIITHKDCASIVPELSPGAESAANLVALLRLLDGFEKQRPQRPVLLTVVNDHVNALHGESEFAFAAFATPESVFAELEQIENDLALQRFIHEVYAQPPSHARLQDLRGRVEDIAGQKFMAKEPVLDKLLSLKNQVREKLSVQSIDLNEKVSRGELTREEMRNQLEPLEQQEDDYVALSMLFNRFGRKIYYDQAAAKEVGGKEYLEDRQRDILHEVFKRIAEDARREADRLEQLGNRLRSNLALRRQLRWLTEANGKPAAADYAQVFAQRHPPLPSIAALTLDLSFGTDKLGFFFIGNLVNDGEQEDAAAKRVAYLSGHTLEVARAYTEQTGRPNVLEDTIRNARGIDWKGHLATPIAMAARAVQQYGHGALTLTGVRDLRPQAFTPHDTVERIHPARFAALMEFVDGYLPAFVNSKDLGVTLRSGLRAASLSIEITALKQDEFTVKLPKTKVQNGLVMLLQWRQTERPLTPQLGEVRALPLSVTDARGTAVFRGSTWNSSSVLVFGYDPAFREVRAALDLAEGEKRFLSTLDLRRLGGYQQRPLLAFDCCKVDLIGLTDTLSLEPALALDIIDARQDSPPRHYSVAGIGAAGANKRIPTSLDGTGCVFVEPHTPFKLRLGDALALNADALHFEGRGFPANVKLLRNLVLVSARDMQQLANKRLELLEEKGVITPTAKEFSEAAAKSLKRVEELREADRSNLVLITAEKARGLAQRAYSRAKGTIDDLIKAVVIFLALIIPFCFFLMKLVIPFTDINRQLASFAAIFAVMTALLFLVHPAFKVAAAPYQVILAFVILGLATFVGSVIFGRFNSSMQQAVEEALMAESADAPQGRLLGAAFMVGVNNMKRRRIRTSLTCATIVLVTFTMLSVLSVGQDVEPARLRLGDYTPYNGFLFTKPGLGSIEVVQLERLRAHFEQKALTVARAWAQRLDKFGTYLGYNIEPTKKRAGAETEVLHAKVLLGLETAEDGFLGPMPLVEGSRWFSANDAKEIILSRDAAALLGITPQNFHDVEVRMESLRLKLVGLLEDEPIEKLRDLDELPLLPVLVAPSQDAVNQLEAMQAEKSSKSSKGGSIFDIPGTHVARAREVAFVPIDIARLMGTDATLRTLSVKFHAGAGEEETAAQVAWQAANELIRFQDVRIAVSVKQPVDLGENKRPLAAGQYALVSSSTAEITGVLKVAIPTILGATIILNTMLGSVMERKREISIYNAIGLNPTHVMVFFLAESLVFGIVGAVAGYLFGQFLSLIIVNLDLLQLNLNYSSLSVIVVIFLTIGTVLASTLYPATMAARAAVPSGQRKWSLPQPKGDEFEVAFPFSYDARRVLGACAYLHDFMQQNSEASTGQFLATFRVAGRVPMSRVKAEAARIGQTDGAGEAPPAGDERAYVMIYDVAPAPFDLGVNQIMEAYAYYDPHVRSHLITVHLRRVSGEINNWIAVNQPFLEALRKRLLNWRSQRPETQQVYYEQGKQLFENAPELAVGKVEAEVQAGRTG